MVETMSVNFFSAIDITASLLSQRVNQSRLKNVLFLSSIWGQFGAKGHTLYCASKGALESAMRSLAIELAPAVRVNCVAFGAVDTPMASRALSDSEIKKRISSDYPLGIGSVEQAVEVCMFLTSESSGWITGQVVTADGGRTAHMSNK
jgi:NAD(P)-dependent dehydrogenase (short-subunit alcohol dehydrogenase family)